MTELFNDPFIPTEYKNAYEHYSFHALCQNAITLLQSVAKQWGGHLFNLKEVLGDHMLELQDCDNILNLPKEDNSTIWLWGRDSTSWTFFDSKCGISQYACSR